MRPFVSESEDKNDGRSERAAERTNGVGAGAESGVHGHFTLNYKRQGFDSLKEKYSTSPRLYVCCSTP